MPFRIVRAPTGSNAPIHTMAVARERVDAVAITAALNLTISPNADYEYLQHATSCVSVGDKCDRDAEGHCHVCGFTAMRSA